MRDRDPFPDEPSTTSEKIMRATFCALDRHGYAGLSIKRIADEADLSKSSVYHFFDDRDELLLAFLDMMISRFEEEFRLPPGEDPTEDLRAYLAHAIVGTPPPAVAEVAPEAEMPIGPIVELRAQAVNDEEFRSRFTDLDAMFEEELASVVERGIEAGAFREVDPERTAALLLTLLMGSILRRATADGLDTESLLDEVDAVLERYLLAEN